MDGVYPGTIQSIDGEIDVWMYGGMERMCGWIAGRLDDEWIDGRIDGWIDSLMDEWMDG